MIAEKEILLIEAVAIARDFEKMFVNFGVHVALTGSTLFKGSSYDDVDLILYPHKTKDGLITFDTVVQVLSRNNIREWIKRDHTEYDDEKTVIKTVYKNTVVDLIW